MWTTAACVACFANGRQPTRVAQTISQAELYVAFLLLNHELNKLPIGALQRAWSSVTLLTFLVSPGKRYEPPTKEYVERMLKTHSTSGSVLTRDEFLVRIA